jgi:hypothetical protein
MISSDRNDENWDDREVEKLRGYGGLKVWKIRKLKRYEGLRRSIILGG